jgi:hypothetical protein
VQLQQIVLLACQAAKGGGAVSAYGTAMTPIAGQWLTTVLEDLKYKYNLKVNRVTQQITLATGTFGPLALESDYLRSYDMWYPLPTSGGGIGLGSLGLPQFLEPLTMAKMDALFKDPSVANYPYFYATDLSTQAQTASGTAGYLYWYPMTSGSIVVTHRYMRNQPDYVTPETNSSVPWFNNSMYLIKETAARMCMTTGDDRGSKWHEEAEAMLRPLLIMEGDEQEAPKQIKFSAELFHMVKNAKLTKSSPL